MAAGPPLRLLAYPAIVFYSLYLTGLGIAMSNDWDTVEGASAATAAPATTGPENVDVTGAPRLSSRQCGFKYEVTGTPQVNVITLDDSYAEHAVFRTLSDRSVRDTLSFNCDFSSPIVLTVGRLNSPQAVEPVSCRITDGADKVLIERRSESGVVSCQVTVWSG